MKFVPNAVTQKVAGAALRTKFHSPQLLFAAGVAGVGATVFLACKATLKLDEVLTDAEKTTQDIETTQHERYSEDDRKKDLMYHRVATFGRVAKLYAPAATVGVVSIACFTQSHRILNRRNAALTAAYATLEKAFKDYRARVRETFGEKGDEVDRKFMYGIQEIEEVDADGKKKTVQVAAEASGYARFFDELNQHWQPNNDLNLWWLQQKQNWLNDRLRAHGHVFLNEVYEELGIDKSPAGQVVGWWWGRDSEGDGIIDFGIWDPDNERARDFVNGRSKGILLDFNVDGPIYDKLGGILDLRRPKR